MSPSHASEKSEIGQTLLPHGLTPRLALRTALSADLTDSEREALAWVASGRPVSMLAKCKGTKRDSVYKALQRAKLKILRTASRSEAA